MIRPIEGLYVDDPATHSDAWSALAAAIRGETAQPLVISAVVAHPDDEVISAGVLLRRMQERGSTVDLVHVTDGAPRDGRDARQQGFSTRDSYASARRAELQQALAVLAVSPRRQMALGVIDQEASFHIAAVATRLSAWFQSLHPDLVLTHPFEGGHPDHDATACAVHRALTSGLVDPLPLLVEFTSYHRGPDGMRVGSFLPGSGGDGDTLLLSGDERNVKRRALECFASQAAIVAWFPIDAERFRPAPRYDFLRPPYEGRPLYEDFDWGMDQARWRELASRSTA